MKIGDHMSTEIVYANLRDGLHQTYTKMQERGIRHMPVLNEKEELVGIISDRDLRHPQWLDTFPNFAPNFRMDNNTKVEQAMSQSPASLKADDDLADAVGMFIERRYGAIPVVDTNNKVIGIISTIDALRAFHQSLQPPSN